MKSVGLPHVGILGGGLAGLALACLLAGRGHPVTVYERDRAGGKLRRAEVGGLTFDTGPSLFTFPEVWRTLLTRLDEPDPLDLRPLPGGLGTQHTPFGAVPLPVPPGHPLAGEWVRYVAAVAPLRPHLLTLLSTPPRLTSPDFLRASWALAGVLGPHLSAEGWIAARRLSPPLAHALRTQALNAGLPPQDAPALYALLPGLIGAEVYRPARGMGAVLDALLTFARRRGVVVREGAEVTHSGVPLGGGTCRGGRPPHPHRRRATRGELSRRLFPFCFVGDAPARRGSATSHVRRRGRSVEEHDDTTPGEGAR